MKTIFTLVILCVFSFNAQPAHSRSFTTTRHGDKSKSISIVSSRGSGDLQVRFTTDKEGEAVITILSESGKTVLQQTSPVTNSVNNIPLKNATGLSEGTYTLRLISGDATYTTTFLIWK